MNLAVPGALVGGYETLVEALKLPAPDDRHVLAAAITAGAVVIVTSNLNDFPAQTLEPLGIGRRPRMTSCSTRSVSMRGAFVIACTRSLVAGHGRRRPMKRSSILSSGPDCSVPRRHCGTDPLRARQSPLACQALTRGH